MIPYSYNMVDMGGIDLAEANGTVVEGLYNRLALARNACGDLILFNWKFVGIEIVPSACSTIDAGTSIIINGMIEVTEEDVVTVLGIDPPPVPVELLTVTKNGTYTAEPPLSGYNPVIVSVETGAKLPSYVSYSENARNIVSFEHTLSPGDYTVVVATTAGLTIGSVLVAVDSVPLQLTEVVSTPIASIRGLAYTNIGVEESSTLTMLTTATAANSGVQMIVFSGEYLVEFVGAAGNNGSSFSMGAGLIFVSYKWGYYSSNNPTPKTTVCAISGDLSSPPTPNDGQYWYGGTYAIKLNEGE